MASVPIITLATAQGPPYGATHFNEIINQSCWFMTEEGVAVKTTVYEAAKIAQVVGKKLQERIVSHYNASQGMGDDQQEAHAIQYLTLQELCKKITALVMLINKDIGDFQPAEYPPRNSRIISTLEDIKRVSKELTRVAMKIKTNFLTAGYVRWCLPDYIKALEATIL